jgi:hypothetical protein
MIIEKRVASLISWQLVLYIACSTAMVFLVCCDTPAAGVSRAGTNWHFSLHTAAGDLVLSGEVHQLDSADGKVAVLLSSIPPADCISRIERLDAFIYDYEGAQRVCGRIFTVDGLSKIDLGVDPSNATVSLPGSATDDEVYLEFPNQDRFWDREYRWYYASEERPWDCGYVEWRAKPVTRRMPN